MNLFDLAESEPSVLIVIQWQIERNISRIILKIYRIFYSIMLQTYRRGQFTVRRIMFSQSSGFSIHSNSWISAEILKQTET